MKFVKKNAELSETWLDQTCFKVKELGQNSETVGN